MFGRRNSAVIRGTRGPVYTCGQGDLTEGETGAWGRDAQVPRCLVDSRDILTS